MERKFKSKIGAALAITLIVVLGSIVILAITSETSWPGVFILLGMISFIIHLFLTTYYIVKSEHLQIKSGFLINITVDINTIRKIIETNSILSAPAMSLDRLEIIYNKYDSVLISPKEKAEFIKKMLDINPNIEVNHKK
ncbi:PH domain-containing protein [Flavobacterium ardleyense]|uniref:PH domain-containing protein n=1 Tax=Flavobacterium ardleyense TaxID=2038737 RepID=A0ABW5ZAX7_9FLAO